MIPNEMAFPVTRGLEGLNKLAIFLNAAQLSGAWHFGVGSRFDQTEMIVDFDNPAELAPTWRRYCATRSGMPAIL